MNKIEESIIEKYITIVYDYFKSIAEFIDENKLDNHSLFFSNGINIIKNIFEYSLIKKKNLNSVDLYSKCSYYYYLEYIKQLQENEIYLEIDYGKTSVFVYEKILNEINTDDTNTITNILSLNDGDDNLLETDIKEILSDINIFINNLFNWNSSYRLKDYKKICKNNLRIVLKYYKNIKIINQYISLLKEKIDIPLNDNINLINNTCSLLTNSKNKNDNELTIVKKFYINEDVLKEKFKSLNTKDFVYWLICHNSR